MHFKVLKNLNRSKQQKQNRKTRTMMKRRFVYISVFVIQVLLWLGVQSVPDMIEKDPNQDLPENER